MLVYNTKGVVLERGTVGWPLYSPNLEGTLSNTFRSGDLSIFPPPAGGTAAAPARIEMARIADNQGALPLCEEIHLERLTTVVGRKLPPSLYLLSLHFYIRHLTPSNDPKWSFVPHVYQLATRAQLEQAAADGLLALYMAERDLLPNTRLENLF